jgi:hypothetical protein
VAKVIAVVIGLLLLVASSATIAPANSRRVGDGIVRPVVASGPDIVCFGDSLTGSGTIPTRLAELTGRTVRNAGVGGENGYGIAARQGSTPYLLTPSEGVIAATGSVDVTFTSSYRTSAGFTAGEKPFLQGTGTGSPNATGTLAGIPGTFYLRVKDPAVAYPQGSAVDIYAFERTTAGTAVVVNQPAPFIYDFAVARRGDIQIIWQGQNGPEEADNTNLFGQEIEYLAAGVPRYLLMSRSAVNDTGWTTEERDLAVRFGRRYLNVRRYLIDYGLADLGITPTAQDKTDIAAGTVPTSLRLDRVHHTVAAQQAIAEFLLLPRLRELGWVN